MFNKFTLTNRIVKDLILNDFNIVISSGCFDVAARRDYSLIIKTLINIDGLLEIHANSMKVLSTFFSANPLIVSMKTNRERLKNNVIYSRFDIPVLSLETFETFLSEDFLPHVCSTRGKHLVKIDTEKMKNRRKELGLTMRELAEKTGLTLKAIYEIENERVNPTINTVKMLEEILDDVISLPYELSDVRVSKFIGPKSSLEKEISREFMRMEIEYSSLYSLPADMVCKKTEKIVTGINDQEEKIKKRVDFMREFTSLFSSECMFIVKKRIRESIDGIPIIQESELNKIESFNELLKIIRERV